MIESIKNLLKKLEKTFNFLYLKNNSKKQYQADGKIKIGPVESMNKKCPNVATEKKLLEALQCVTSYKVEGALLKLYCEEKAVLQFESYRN